MSGTDASIVRMANDIARNCALQGESSAVASVAQHIKLFWAPRMQRIAFGMLDKPQYKFSAIAREALSQLSNNKSDHAG